MMSASDAAMLIKDGMTVALSGYSMAGYPKAVLQQLVQRPDALKLNVVSGANIPWVDELLSNHEMISWRAPMCADRNLSRQVNSGHVVLSEQQMCDMPSLLRKGKFGHIDVAIIEALGFDAQGRLIPTTSVGMTQHLIDTADAIIIEMNKAYPKYLRLLHDIYQVEPYPLRKPIPLEHPAQRIGEQAMPINHEKIIGIVETHIPEIQEPSDVKIPSEAQAAAAHLCTFLATEYVSWQGKLPPIQSGFGTMADAVAHALGSSSFHDLEFFCGGVSPAILQLLASGKASAVSTGGIVIDAQTDALLAGMSDLEKRLVIRNGDITNSAEVVSRFGLIAVNTGIEIDIYGNVNASHISGSAVVNGIGGGADFAHNADLSVVLIPSTAKKGAISCIVPMVAHQDICEHDVDVVITEHGVADLRGLSEHQRSEAIIEHCTAGVYQKQLRAYRDEAEHQCGNHHPQLPDQAFAWYRRLQEKKTMVQEFV
jgi:succinyl-CoA:acetate CoA-transferase